MSGFRQKVFYLGACFALGMSVILLRIYTLQVVSAQEYRDRSEVVRLRQRLLFPPRARIVAADGSVLADNEAVWELTLNAARFAAPEDMVRRAVRSPTEYPTPEDVYAFHREKVQPLIERTFDSAARARRFLLLWQLRGEALARYDLQVCLEQAAALSGAAHDELARSFDLIDREVRGITERVGDVEKAPGAAVNRAYYRAYAAATDPEYWERVRRFPKSLAFEPRLERRVDWCRRRRDMAAALLDAATREPEFSGRLVEEAFARIAARRRECEAAADQNEDAAPIDGAADAERPDIHEEARAWKILEEQVGGLDSRKDAASIRNALATLVESYDGRGGEIDRLEQRLANLREKIIRPWREDYEHRWRGYLAPDAFGNPLMRDNPLIVSRGVERARVEAIALNADALDGIDAEADMRRIYPKASAAPHIIGSLRQPNRAELFGGASDEGGADEAEETPTLMERIAASPNLAPFRERWFGDDLERFRRSFSGELARRSIGAGGIEAFYQARLAGEPGARVAYADARGRARGEPNEWPPSAASDLRLTLDLELQHFAAATIERWEPRLRNQVLASPKRRAAWDAVGREHWGLRGALVIIDLRDGGIPALVNFPSYDPDLLRASGEEGERYRHSILHGDDDLPPTWYWLKRAPMLNRAVAGHYAPGSTFKMLSAIAMLESGAAAPDETYNEMANTDRGTAIYQGNGFRLVSNHPAGPGIDMEKALTRSCNGYFWRFSEKFPGKTSSERYRSTFYPWARAFGFGESPGLDIPAGRQSRGSLPGTDGPVNVAAGELALNCIGQGRLSVTPLQLARFIAAIAERGRLPRPHLCVEAVPTAREINVSQQTWDIIHRGMKGVVFDSQGTARKSGACRRIRAAGKTGTAQPGKFRDKEGRLHDIPDHAWFAGFAPYEKPEVAFVMLAEYSGLAGGDIAEVVGEVVEHYLKKKPG